MLLEFLALNSPPLDFSGETVIVIIIMIGMTNNNSSNIIIRLK